MNGESILSALLSLTLSSSRRRCVLLFVVLRSPTLRIERREASGERERDAAGYYVFLLVHYLLISSCVRACPRRPPPTHPRPTDSTRPDLSTA